MATPHQGLFKSVATEVKLALKTFESLQRKFVASDKKYISWINGFNLPHFSCALPPVLCLMERTPTTRSLDTNIASQRAMGPKATSWTCAAFVHFWDISCMASKTSIFFLVLCGIFSLIFLAAFLFLLYFFLQRAYIVRALEISQVQTIQQRQQFNGDRVFQGFMDLTSVSTHEAQNDNCTVAVKPGKTTNGQELWSARQTREKMKKRRGKLKQKDSCRNVAAFDSLHDLHEREVKIHK